MGRGLHTVAAHIGCWTRTFARYTVHAFRSLSTNGYPRQMQTHNLAATNMLLEPQYSPWEKRPAYCCSPPWLLDKNIGAVHCARVQKLVNYWPCKTDANTQLRSHKCDARAAIFTMGRGLHTVAVHLGCWTRTLARYTVHAFREAR
jgi:hypothetical protein